MEEWRDCIGFKNYQASNLGNIRNKKRLNVIKPRADVIRNTYTRFQVNVTNELGKQVNQRVHRLVAKAFIPNPDNRTEIDHIDGDPSNNRVDNLRWSTRSEQNFNTRVRSDNILGEKNIHLLKRDRLSRYRVSGVRYKTRDFQTLEEAIKYRDSV